MRRKITAAVVLQALAQFTTRFPRNARADSIPIACHAFQSETEPIVPLGRVVFQQHRSSSVRCDEHVQRAVVVVVAHSQAPRSEGVFKRCASLRAYIFQLSVWALMKEQERLLVPNLSRVTTDHVVGMAVGQDQIERAIVVIVEVLESPAA